MQASEFSVLGRSGFGVARRRQAAGPPPAATTPGQLTEGVKCSSGPVGRVLGLDWITMSGPEGRRDDAERILSRYFGPVIETTRGQYFCQTCFRFEGGAQLHFGHKDGVCVVALGGAALSTLEAGKRIDVMREVLELLGFRVTRLDIAQDYFHCGLGLVAMVEGSCERGEVVGCPVFDVRRPRRGDRLNGYSVTVGKKGSEGSGRQVCVYDKGLEQKERGEGLFWKLGEWERWETRLFDERANEAALAIVGAGPSWHPVAKGYMLGAIEFREKNGHRKRAERPMVAWWSKFCEFTRLCSTSAVKRLKTLSGKVTWFRKQVAPGLAAMADAAGMTMGTVLETFAGDVRAGPRASLLRRQFREWIDGGADFGELCGAT